MKTNLLQSFSSILLIGFILLPFSCKKDTDNSNPSTDKLPSFTNPSSSPVSDITASSARFAVTISGDGGGAITARGVVWNTSPAPTVALSTKTTDGSGTGSFVAFLSGLTPKTKYYARPYATNANGTIYGTEFSFTTANTPANLPVFDNPASSPITGITSTSAQFAVAISSDGGSTISARGVCWSTNQNPTATLNTKTSNGNGIGTFTANLSGLTANTPYFARAYATNGNGTNYGTEFSFTTTNGNPPVFNNPTSSPITAIKSTSAKFQVTISSDGGSAITARGVCWSTSQNPTVAIGTKTNNGTGTGTFTANMTGLSGSTTYYARGYATNENGTSYGTEFQFTTSAPLFTPGSGVTDIDGNNYQTIIIGSQEWMKENLKVSKYRNGAPIPTNLNNTQWTNTGSGAYAIYNNNIANEANFGKLYNGYAVTDPRGLCPTGWHVASDAEWTTLENFLGSGYFAGGKMKDVSDLWASPNENATDESGFSGLPGGSRDAFGDFMNIGKYGSWWSSTQYQSTDLAWYRTLSFDNGASGRGYFDKQVGRSVRCIRD